MTAPVAGAIAPPAPGGIGMPIEPAEALGYLEALGHWREDRKRELDQLDEAALKSPEAAALTGDVTLAMALWKSVSDRYDLLVATWDSGRVGPAERERMSSLIWGRLDSTLDTRRLSGSSAAPDVSALAVSLPEACRLSDALVAQLRVRLALDPSGLAVAERVRQARVQLERIRDQVALEADAARRDKADGERHELMRRLTEITEKAGRGGDVDGLLGPLEIDATKFERDLIVDAATRRQAEARADQARVLRADLVVRAGALKKLVEQCVTAVDSSPRYAVPDVQALGPIPTSGVEVDSYLRRLEQVSRAMTLAQDAYSRALRERDELVGRLEVYHAKAEVTQVRSAQAEQIFELARQELASRPVRMAIASQLVSLYRAYLDADTPPNRTESS